MMTIARMLEEAASQWPEQSALVFKGRKLTYRNLFEEAKAVAYALVHMNLEPQNRLAILLPNCPEYVALIYGTLLAGGVVVPINTMLSSPEIASILEDCTPRILVTGTGFLKEAGAWLKSGLIRRIIVVEEQNRPKSKGINCDDTVCQGPEKIKPQAGVRAGQEPEVRGLRNYRGHPTYPMILTANPVPLPRVDPTSLAVLFYTSGTTGEPKGVMLTHFALLSNVEASSKALRVSPKDRLLVFLPLFHSFTFTVTILLPCFVGARIVLLDAVKREAIQQAIIRERVTMFIGIPSIYRILAGRRLSWLKRRLNPVRIYISGGAPLPGDVLDDFRENFQRPLLEGYGLSETAPVVSINPLEKSKAGSVGKPIPGVQVKAVDDGGEDLAAQLVGELLVRGPNLMEGYWGKPNATREAMRDGWLYTGDLARLDEDGYIYIVGRRKDMLIVHGCNVYPREIEEALCRHPEVHEAAVVGAPDKARGEVPVAYVVLKDGMSTSEAALRQHCQNILASYKVPHRIEFRETLPKTASGKILKRVLREPI